MQYADTMQYNVNTMSSDVITCCYVIYEEVVGFICYFGGFLGPYYMHLYSKCYSIVCITCFWPVVYYKLVSMAMDIVKFWRRILPVVSLRLCCAYSRPFQLLSPILLPVNLNWLIMYLNFVIVAQLIGSNNYNIQLMDTIC